MARTLMQEIQARGGVSGTCGTGPRTSKQGKSKIPSQWKAAARKMHLSLAEYVAHRLAGETWDRNRGVWVPRKSIEGA